MKERMEVSSNPHIRSKDSTDNIMLSVVIALMPATLFGVWNFGWYAHVFAKVQAKASEALSNSISINVGG